MHGPFLALHGDLGEVFLGDAELMHVAAGELGVDGRDGRAVGKLELRAGVGGGAHRGGVDEQLHRVGLHAQHVVGHAGGDGQRRLADHRVDAGAMKGDLGGHAHRHLHVRGEDVVPLRAPVGPGRAPGEQDVDVVLADAGILERGPTRLGGELQRVLDVLLVGVRVAHADDGGDLAQGSVRFFQSVTPFSRKAARAAWRSRATGSRRSRP